MKKILIAIILVLLAIGGTFVWKHRHHIFHGGGDSQKMASRYTCPMHHQIIRDGPGTCPICGMTLVPVEEESAPDKGKEGTFLLTPERRQIIGATFATIGMKPLRREIRLPGRVAFDPDLYVTEQEYVTSLKTGVGGELLGAIETKLRRLGISGGEMERMKKSRLADNSLFLPAGEGSYWVYASVYEQELEWIVPGMKAQIALAANASVELEGTLEALTPILDPMTRTATARIRVESPAVSLKPETYVDVTLQKELGSLLAVPANAVIDTGLRQIVFVDLKEGRMEPREVRLGLQAGENYPVVAGLSEGEAVLTSAHFLIDSEAQIQQALKKFGGSGGMPMGGHQH